jgi:hypothetical protein
VSGGLGPRVRHWSTSKRSSGHGGIVDYPVADHLDHVVFNDHIVCRHLGDPPRQLV